MGTYTKGLAISFLIYIVVVASYIFFTHTDSAQMQNVEEVNYVFDKTSSPIQPIPLRINFDEGWAELGRALFHSQLLSSDNSISCASCHQIAFGGDDGFPVSTGVNNQVGTRNSPTVLNSTFSIAQFWDGRSENLEQQVSGPVHNPVEMNTNWAQVIAKLNNDPDFKVAFTKVSPGPITINKILQAITIYEQTLITINAPIDRFLRGDKKALNAQQTRGWEKFNSLGCITCHQGVNIGGNLFQKVGRITEMPESLKQDLGRFNITQKESDKHVFKVPSLRNIADTAPYFHDGSVKTLPQAVKLMARLQLGLDISQQDQDDIVALLKSFSGELYQ